MFLSVCLHHESVFVQQKITLGLGKVQMPGT